MKTYRFDNFIDFVQGVNQSRIERLDDYELLYDNSCFNLDYESMYTNAKSLNFSKDINYLVSGDIVISISLQKATVVSMENEGKILPINFVKVNFKDERLDKTYFLYLMNFNKIVKKCIDRNVQGSGIVQRITLNSLGKIEIELPEMEIQKRIGEVYLQMIKMQKKINEYSNLIGKMTYSILENKEHNHK